MHDARQLTEARLKREQAERVAPAIWGPRALLDCDAYELPGEPVPIPEALAGATWSPIAPGAPYGRPWGTTYLRARGRAPESTGGGPIEALVELGYQFDPPGFQAEGLVIVDGKPRCGVHPRRRNVPLPGVAPGAPVELLVEAASNPSFIRGFSPTPLGSLSTAGKDPIYTFGGIWVAERRVEVYALDHDLDILSGLMRRLPTDDPRRARILATIERALDALDLAEVPTTAPRARAILAPLFELPARASAHRIIAMGHAHIDTAWLWPLRETQRKCTRTFASAVELMDEYPEFVFACSQAAQYDWIERQHPELFEKIRAKVATGQWQPVGGMWVEADMNVPSGEAIVRQLVHGQHYFESRFGTRCKEIWIPDVFGYPASLPQIFVEGGCERFVTQKLSWNKQNRMPHHTFRWCGVDGTAVLAHFPPVDNYNAEITPRELAYAQTNFRDAAWSDWSLMPFGYGDGGGGPTREMLERARRLGDLDGTARVEIGTPDDFFTRVEAEVEAVGDLMPEWRGELYFEMHRGTYTTQTNTKVGNRRGEHLLRETELWWAATGRADYPAAELDALWKRLLILQFHDIIPGSSIAWVYEDAEREYTAIAERCEQQIAEAMASLATTAPALADSTTHARDEIVADAVRPFGDGPVQQLSNGHHAFRATMPGLGLAEAGALPVDDTVVVTDRNIENTWLRVTLGDHGYLQSVLDKRSGRELFGGGRLGNELYLAPDHPVEYDAWDLEQWTRRLAAPITSCDAITVEDAGPLVGTIAVNRTFGASSVVQRITLRAGRARLDLAHDIDWHEDEQLLWVAFPLAVHTDQATCDIQFATVARPTHANTSWDAAKFEVCAHRFVDVSEHTFGVAVLNDGRYGHAVRGGEIRVTLQRSPQFPAPHADHGRHQVTLALLPHGAGLDTVVREAEALNLPVRVVTGGAATLPPPLVTIDSPGVLVDAVKRADDGAGDLIVRLHEHLGDRRTIAIVGPRGPAERTNLLEDPGATVDPAAVALRPFELATFRLS